MFFVENIDFNKDKEMNFIFQMITIVVNVNYLFIKVNYKNAKDKD